jgi:hypothetical protein
MKLSEHASILWGQQATYQYGPPGLIPVEYRGSLKDCVSRASGYLDFANPPGSFRIAVDGFETATETEIRRLATLLPVREELPDVR